MRRLATLTFLAVLFGLNACHQPDSVVVVSVTAESGVPAVARLRVTMSNRGAVDVKLFPEIAGSGAIVFPATLSIVMSRSRSGDLALAVDGLDGSSVVVANGDGHGAINVGARTDISVVLASGASPCGNSQVDPGEQCDDQNRVSGDGCDYQCRSENPIDGGTSDASGGRGGGGAGSSGSGGAGGSAGTGATGGSAGMGGATAGSAGTGGATGGSAGARRGAGGSVGGSGGSAGTGGGTGGSGGTTLCGQVYVDLTNSNGNCGACGYACVNGRTCMNGRCSPVWQPIATANGPGPRIAHAAAALAGRFYVMGGVATCNGSSNSIWAYEASTNAWTSAAPMNSARTNHAAVASSTRIYVFGGITNCAAGNTTGPLLEAFDPNVGWMNVSASGTPSPRYAFSMTWTGSEVFLYGGGDNTRPFLNTGGRLNPSAATFAWSDASCSLGQCERGNGALFAWNGIVYRWGGNGGNAPAGLQYNLGTGAWSAWSMPAGTPSLVSPANADAGRYMYVLAPAATGCPSTIEVHTLDKQTMTWLPVDQSAGTGNLGAAGSAAAWTGTEVLVWSGNGACGTTTAYDGGGRYQPAAR